MKIFLSLIKKFPKNIYNRKLFTFIFIINIFLNTLTPFLYNNLDNYNLNNSGVAYAQDDESPDPESALVAGADNKNNLSKEEISAAIMAQNVKLIDIAEADINKMLRSATSDEDKKDLAAVLKFFNDKKKDWFDAYNNNSLAPDYNYDKAEEAFRDAVYDSVCKNNCGLKSLAVALDFSEEGNLGLKNKNNGKPVLNFYTSINDLVSKTSGWFSGAKTFTKEELDEMITNNTQAAATQSVSIDAACKKESMFDVGYGVCTAVWYITQAVVGASALLAGMFINIFAYAIDWGILNMKDKFDLTANILDGLASQNLIFVMWKIVRDIVNVLVFFSAIYIGIRRILGDEGDFVKNITRVLMFAFFVNFSYPISKFLIDISNASSLFVYNSIIDPSAAGTTLSGQILASLGFGFLSSLFMEGKIDTSNTFTSSSSWTSMILIFILSLIMIFVFLFLSVMVFVRGLVLIFCVIFSPLMFANGFLGFVNDFQKKWADNFFGNLVFAPVMMVGLYIIMNILLSTSANSGAISTTGDMSSLGRLIMAIIGFILVYLLAKTTSGSVGSALGSVAMKTFSTTGMFLGGGVLAGGAVKALGAGMGRLSGSSVVQNMAKRPTGMRKFMANSLINTTDKVQNMKAGFGRFARPTTYAEDVKTANYKALKNPLLKSMNKKERQDFIEKTKQIKTVGGQRDLEKRMSGISNIADGDRQSELLGSLKEDIKDRSIDDVQRDERKQYIESKARSLGEGVKKVNDRINSFRSQRRNGAIFATALATALSTSPDSANAQGRIPETSSVTSSAQNDTRNTRDIQIKNSLGSDVPYSNSGKYIPKLANSINPVVTPQEAVIPNFKTGDYVNSGVKPNAVSYNIPNMTPSNGYGGAVANYSVRDAQVSYVNPNSKPEILKSENATNVEGARNEASSGVNTTEKPGFLMTAEDKIRERFGK